MDNVSAMNIEELVHHRNGWCVTMYLPTHPATPEGLQDHVRLKNLLTQAETALVEKGLRAPEAHKMLGPAKELVEDNQFWHDRRQGLAVFLAEDLFRTFRLPLAFEEELAVDHRFHIKQLLPLAVGQGQVLILALSRNDLRLLAASPEAYAPVKAKGLPASMREALNIAGADRGEQVHAAAGGSQGIRLGKQGTVFHGQGGEADVLKEEIKQYFRIVADALQNVLHQQTTPLLLAGVEYELPIFREVCSYPHLEEGQIAGNFDHASDHELYERAQPLVREILQKPRQAAAIRYREIADTAKASDDLRTILVAASRGKIDTLFLDFRAKIPGHFGAETESCDRHDTEEAQDLLDIAAVETLNNHGTVYAVERNEMPCAAPIAAVFRY